ncbi:ATP-binding cassette domain-containing protein [Nocardia suismassiliense]|uniref:ATP-binding cassette domain-containing protein n=1 Tax=Nocardia suismassiliense TaxID=2077092 RepID=A0ABW6R674_9NOCA
MHTFVLDRVGVVANSTPLLVDLDVTMPGGRCTAVVGPSGTGKTTLLRLLNRLAEPSSGRILLDDTPITELDVLALRRRVGLVPQRPVLLADVVADELRVGCADLSTAQATALLARVGLPESFAERRCAELSGGEAQRVCLARALAVEPDVLLLDEPTSALDAVAATAVAELIRAHVGAGGTVVLVSHDHSFVRTAADDILILDDKHLTQDGPADQIDRKP